MREYELPDPYESGRYVIRENRDLFDRVRGKVKKTYERQSKGIGSGYRVYSLRCNDGKFRFEYEHRLMAIAFLPNPEGKLEVNHIDFNKANNELSNLEWLTKSENQLHARDRLGPTRIKWTHPATGDVYKSKSDAKRKGVNPKDIYPHLYSSEYNAAGRLRRKAYPLCPACKCDIHSA